MNKKKVFMIILLCVFIAIIGVVVSRINKKSEEKLNASENVNETESATKSADAKVRKASTEVKTDTENMVEITDNYFIEQTNDVYINLDDYIGKTIKMEGFIYSYEDTDGEVCYAVIRNTPGCCGSDGLAGLDIRYNGEYPAEDTWVEVVGVMGVDTVFGSETPAIQVATITEKEEGVSFVTN